MSEKTKRFEELRYRKKSVSEKMRQDEKDEMKKLLKSMTDEEFEEIIQATGIVQAKIYYKKLRKND